MTTEEIKILSEKVASDTATPAEKLSLLKELNSIIENMRQDVAALNRDIEIEGARSDISSL